MHNFEWDKKWKLKKDKEKNQRPYFFFAGENRLVSYRVFFQMTIFKRFQLGSILKISNFRKRIMKTNISTFLCNNYWNVVIIHSRTSRLNLSFLCSSRTIGFSWLCKLKSYNTKVIVRVGWESTCIVSRRIWMLGYKDFLQFIRERDILTPLS